MKNRHKTSRTNTKRNTLYITMTALTHTTQFIQNVLLFALLNSASLVPANPLVKNRVQRDASPSSSADNGANVSRLQQNEVLELKHIGTGTYGKQ